jgi:hypothetical protein
METTPIDTVVSDWDEQADPRRGSAPASPPGADAGRETEATSEFLRRVRAVEGVAEAVILAVRPGKTTIQVRIPSLQSEVAEQVFEAEAEVRRCHPGAGLEIRIREGREGSAAGAGREAAPH